MRQRAAMRRMSDLEAVKLVYAQDLLLGHGDHEGFQAAIEVVSLRRPDMAPQDRYLYVNQLLEIRA